MITVEGPIFAIALEKDGKRIIMFGEDHTAPTGHGDSVHIQELLKEPFEKGGATFYIETYDGEYDPSEQNTISVLTSLATQYPQTRVVLNDIRQYLPLYSTIFKIFNSRHIFRNYEEHKRYYSDVFKAQTFILSHYRKNGDIERDLLKINQNRVDYLKIIADMANRASHLEGHKDVPMNEFHDLWFADMIILNDLYTIQDILQNDTMMNIVYMGYFHILNITYRLVHNYGFKILWSSSGPLSIPDLRHKHSSTQLSTLEIHFKIDPTPLQSTTLFNDALLTAPDSSLSIWNQLRQKLKKISVYTLNA